MTDNVLLITMGLEMAENRLVIKNGKVLLADGRLVECDVLAEGGIIIRKIGLGLTGGCEVDAGGALVLPGLIDLHTHGIQFQSSGAGDLKEYAALEAERGTATFYPTLFGPPDESAANMERHRRETDELREVPQIAGFRLESPYLAGLGAGIARDLAPISRDITDMLLDAGGGHVKIWDVSPELPGAPDEISYLTWRGVVCSLAHTMATIDQAKAAINAGARLITHLYDVFPLPQQTEPGVYPAGLVDYLLVEDRVMCEIIGDGTHVDPLNVEKTFRCKTTDRIVFVTDSNFGAGLPSGRYDLPGGWGIAEINGSNNGVRLVDREMGLAGSALTPIDLLRNVVKIFGKDIATASKLCSTTPARLMGLNKGEIRVGRDADFTIIDPEFNVLCTIAAGQVVYKK